MNGLAAELSQLIVQGLPFLIPIVGSIGLFAFLAVESWANSRRKEREAFFRHELLKKLSENPSDESQRVLDVMRQEQIDRQERQRNGIKLGGWITLGTGVGLGVMLSQLAPGGVWAVGALPALIGLAMVLHASTSDSRAKSAR
jgi:hypothetical protein